MVESKNKTTAARAKIAHKLAKYYRATPINLTGTNGVNQPSISHLSIASIIQNLEEPPSSDSETKQKLGTPPTTRRSASKELPRKSPSPREESPSPPAPLSS